MKRQDWQSLHIAAYKAFIQQKYGNNMEVAINNTKLGKILEIRDEDKFDNELIKLQPQE